MRTYHGNWHSMFAYFETLEIFRSKRKYVALGWTYSSIYSFTVTAAHSCGTYNILFRSQRRRRETEERRITRQPLRQVCSAHSLIGTSQARTLQRQMPDLAPSKKGTAYAMLHKLFLTELWRHTKNIRKTFRYVFLVRQFNDVTAVCVCLTHTHTFWNVIQRNCFWNMRRKCEFVNTAGGPFKNSTRPCSLTAREAINRFASNSACLFSETRRRAKEGQNSWKHVLISILYERGSCSWE